MQKLKIIIVSGERTDLFERYPKIANNILKKINHYVSISKKSRRTFESDKLCDPKLHNGTWSWWVKDEDINEP